jgi:hypothetical protein
MNRFLFIGAFVVLASGLSALASWAGCGPSQPAAADSQPVAVPSNEASPRLHARIGPPREPAAAQPVLPPGATASPPIGPPCCGPQPVALRGSATPLVDDLVAVMGETKSKGTFLAAVITLGQMGAEARPAVAAILRNGERLGVFTGTFSLGSNGPGQEHIVLEVLGAIVCGQPMGGPRGPLPPAVPQPVPPPPVQPTPPTVPQPVPQQTVPPTPAVQPHTGGPPPMPTGPLAPSVPLPQGRY